MQRNAGQQWLGCMLTAGGTQLQHIYFEYHLQQGSVFLPQTSGYYWTQVYPLPNA